jgi:hypothetical protein
MSISIQGLNDTIVALIVTIGIAVVLSIALGAAGFYFERSKARARKLVRATATPAQHPTQTDNTRELVLR